MGEPILCHNEIEAESTLLVQEDLDRKDLDIFEDTNEDYMYNDEESVHVAKSEDSVVITSIATVEQAVEAAALPGSKLYKMKK